MPSIAQQDYIVIDCEGYSSQSMPAEKLNSIKEQLKRIADSNPHALLSVLFKNYDDDTDIVSSVIFYSLGEQFVRFSSGQTMVDFSYI